MKRIILSYTFMMILFQASTYSQTALDSVLMHLPAQSTAELQLYMDQLVDLGPSAIVAMAKNINGHLPGKYDMKEHYALSGLARYVDNQTDTETKQVIEEGFIEALNSDLDVETDVFLIEQLRSLASDKSLSTLQAKISKLCEPAIQAIAAIGSDRSIQVLIDALNTSQGYCKMVIAKAIGKTDNQTVTTALTDLLNDSDQQIKMTALNALIASGKPQAFPSILNFAKANPGTGNALLLKYGEIMAQKGNTQKLSEILDQVEAVGDAGQKLTALSLRTQYLETASQKMLLKTLTKGSIAEGKAIANALIQNTDIGLEPYMKVAEKVDPEVQIGLLSAAKERNYTPALSLAKALLNSNNGTLKSVAIKSISKFAGSQSIPDLQKVIYTSSDPLAVKTAIEELSHWVKEDNLNILMQTLAQAPDRNKAPLIRLLADRGVTELLANMESYLQSSDPTVREVAFQSLPQLVKGAAVTDLMPFISIAETPEELSMVQEAFKAKAKEYNQVDEMVNPLLNTFGESSPALLSKILPAIGGHAAVEYIRKANMPAAILGWKYPEVIPDLFKMLDSKQNRDEAFNGILRLIGHPQLPDDQRVLYLKKLMPYTQGVDEKEKIVNALGNTRSHSAFMYIRGLLQDDALKVVAANALVQAALPVAGEEFGLIGKDVKMGLMQADTILETDAYTTSILRKYLSIIPEKGGFVSLFNGKDLSGWQGLVENPIARDTMFRVELKNKQIEADAKMAQNWKVENGLITFFGDGFDNLCSEDSYRDFELLVDWKITKNGDSGIYLRGSPQVQIWDTSMTGEGAQVGSGGLYNNQEHENKPLTVADNPVGEWNTFRIIMIEDKVTVYLNGVLVTDNVTLENYWNRELPIFRTGPVELQAHGTNLQFRDIYIQEINSAPDLSKREQEEGYQTIFNGINLDGWVGNKTDYVVKDGELVIYPGGSGGHGNLYTEKEYDNFTIRFEFKLTPGANNGLGIHAPLEGDAAYVGKEIQILDNSSPIYANLKEYQYHGSVYGLVPALKGALNPVGEWNSEEVRVKGNQIWVIVNNKRIVFDDLDNATRDGTLDGKEHPGLKRLKGHIGFLGHGSEVHFRNIRIKEGD